MEVGTIKIVAAMTRDRVLLFTATSGVARNAS
jgi:hypothetical protein